MTIETRTFTQSMKELTSDFQRDMLAFVQSEGSHGVTDDEAQGYFNKGHGTTSSALSTLHKQGYITRLKEKRGRFTVYVMPKFVEGRDTHPPYTNKGLIPADHSVCEATEHVLVLTVEALKAEVKELKKKWRTSRALSD